MSATLRKVTFFPAIDFASHRRKNLIFHNKQIAKAKVHPIT